MSDHTLCYTEFDLIIAVINTSELPNAKYVVGFFVTFSYVLSNSTFLLLPVYTTAFYLRTLGGEKDLTLN